MIDITNMEILIAMMFAFLIGCIPLLCCICLQEYAEWQIKRERK